MNVNKEEGVVVLEVAYYININKEEYVVFIVVFVLIFIVVIDILSLHTMKNIADDGDQTHLKSPDISTYRHIVNTTYSSLLILCKLLQFINIYVIHKHQHILYLFLLYI